MIRTCGYLSKLFDPLFPGYKRAQVVLAHGCFDPLHIGHVRYLQAASQLGDGLVVTVTPDRFVNKPGRPVFNESLRMEALDALRCVDYVALNEWPTAVETILLLRPAVYVKGGEYKDAMTPALEAEKAAIEEVGGRLVFTDTEQWHSTDLLEKMRTAELAAIGDPRVTTEGRLMPYAEYFNKPTK